MMRMSDEPFVADVVLASNILTCRWARELDRDENSVISGAGVWLLLVALLAAADGDALNELTAATGITQVEALQSFNAAVKLLRRAPGVEVAVGMWTHPDVELNEGFVQSLRAATVATLPTDLEPLHQWARDNTRGLINTFPGSITTDSRFVAASALAAEAEWLHRFSESFGQWQEQPGCSGWLRRTGTDRDSAALVSNGSLMISRVVCETNAGFDVHLVAGSADDAPGPVIALAVDAIFGHATVLPGSSLRAADHGGCLVVETIDSLDKTPKLMVSVPAFDITTNHDLLRTAQPFGLVAAQDATRGHFPELSSFPLAVQSAAQSAIAGFSAAGFRAAAVTAIAVMGGSAAPSKRALAVHVNFNRPFGFLAVDRKTGLVLFAGWVAQPKQPDV